MRSVGSITFGIAADRYGRKWPYIVNMVLFIILELGTGFCNTYEQFLGVRAIYGIAMGGLYGNAAATALEDCPAEARGIVSGMLQQGYAFGYLLATVFARALVGTTSHDWRPLYWFGACPPVLLIIFRLLMPETQAYRERELVRHATGNLTSTFLSEGKVALRRHWKLLTYMVLLMAGFNFMSHGSQDLYPTLLQNEYSYNANQVTVTQVVANLGAMAGGTTVGFLSQSLGRRFSIIVTSIVGGILLYPYDFVSNNGLNAAAFFEQFCVQGAWGVIPIHLMELSPGSFRTFVVGTSYQLGNLVSSASSTIEATIGERFPLAPEQTAKGPVPRYNYGIVICIVSSSLVKTWTNLTSCSSWHACTFMSSSSRSLVPSIWEGTSMSRTTRICDLPLAKMQCACCTRKKPATVVATMWRRRTRTSKKGCEAVHGIWV